MLSHDQVKAIYDRFGARQDSQAYYEDVATAELIRHADFGQAHHVFEFGCGTGRLAAALFEHHLPPTASYAGVDLSTTMVQLTGARLARWQERVLVLQSSGSPCLPVVDRSCDRFIATYVLDILAPAEIIALLAEARRVLQPGGRLALVSLTYGGTAFSRLVSWGWEQVYRFRPAAVGGCRPIELVTLLEPGWELNYHTVVAAYGIASEVIIAVPRQL